MQWRRLKCPTSHRALAHILSAGTDPAPALANQPQHAFEGWHGVQMDSCDVQWTKKEITRERAHYSTTYTRRCVCKLQCRAVAADLQLTSGGWERSATERHTENCLPDQVRKVRKTGYWVPGCPCSGGASLPAAGCTPLRMLLALHPSPCSPLWLNAHPAA